MPNIKDIMRLKALLRPPAPPTEQQVAHMIAQRHAAMPTQHGGLGLPATNTPMDRAAALGYDLPAYRGTRSNEQALYANTQQVPGKVRSGTGVFMSEDPSTASTYAGNMGGNVMPLMVRSKGMQQVNAGGAPWSDIAGRDTNQIAREALAAGQPGVRFQNVADPGAHLRGVPNIPETANNLTAFNPADVRSRFAAFDPLKQHSEDMMHAGGGLIKSGLGALKQMFTPKLSVAEQITQGVKSGRIPPEYEQALRDWHSGPAHLTGEERDARMMWDQWKQEAALNKDTPREYNQNLDIWFNKP